jgi:hypothetical protein
LVNFSSIWHWLFSSTTSGKKPFASISFDTGQISQVSYFVFPGTIS